MKRDCPSNYTRETLGANRIIYIPEMHVVAKVGRINEYGGFEFEVLNGAWIGRYEASTKSVIIHKQHEIKPVTILYLDTEKMPPDLKSEWYL